MKQKDKPTTIPTLNFAGRHG